MTENTDDVTVEAALMAGDLPVPEEPPPPVTEEPAPAPVEIITEAPGDPTHPVGVLLEEHPATPAPPAPVPGAPEPGPEPDAAPAVPVSGGGQEEIA
ncbi:hypothetical protein ACF1G0_24385 [Streptomyces sp. NPDC013953]|uniref:hypothetical protein n=1 Tax=Streptomyces sp. NPDC013953 TaxID=3364868 RepID=UPI0036FE6E16